MKTKLALLTLGLSLTLCAAPALKPVSAENQATMKGFIEKNLTELKKAFPAPAPRVLVFSHCEGFVHGEAIVHANAMYRAAGEAGLIRPDFSTDYTALTADNLDQYQVLIINNATHLKIKEGDDLQKSIAGFVRGGGGYVLLHGGLDTFTEAPTLCDISQGLFDGHPWHAGGTWTFKIDAPNSPLTAMFGKEPFKFSDEIYQHKRPYADRSKINVLISLDMSDPVTAKSNEPEKQNNKEKNDYPVSWTRNYGKGKVFATSFGHDQRAYLNEPTFMHMLLGTAWTLPK